MTILTISEKPKVYNSQTSQFQKSISPISAKSKEQIIIDFPGIRNIIRFKSFIIRL